MKWTAKDVCAAYGVDRRSVTNWLNESPPLPSRMEGRVRVFVAAEVVAWHEARAVRAARSQWEKEPKSLDDEVQIARDRRTINEARLVELELEEAEGRLLPLDVHEQRVRALCEPLAARCRALSKYVGDVQLATTDAEAGAVLDRIGDELLASLMATEVSDGDEDTEEVAA
jgi:hypothetical protein